MIYRSSKSFVCIVVNLLLFSDSITESGSCPYIIERAQWGARPGRDVNYLVTPLLYVVIHHTATPSCKTVSDCIDRVKNLQNYQMGELKHNDIDYSFLVGNDGNIYEGTGWSIEGSHTPGYNKKSISIAFIGNYHYVYRNSTVGISVDKDINEDILKKAHDLVTCGVKQGYLRREVKVVGARQVTNTASPGKQLYDRIQTWPEWGAVQYHR